MYVDLLKITKLPTWRCDVTVIT